MQITQFTIESVYGIRAVDVPITTPVTLFAGWNEAGKSSIGDAIRLALTGDPVRVSFKKDLHFALNGTAKAGVVSITGDGWDASIALPSGKITQHNVSSRVGFEPTLCPQWFSSIGTDERRAFLSQLFSVDLDAATMVNKLEARGIPRPLIDRFAVQFGRVPWSDLANQAAKLATEEKGAWRQVTGEQWGERKAAEWLPTVPPAPAGSTPVQVAADIASTEAEIEGFQREIGASSARAAAVIEQERKAGALRETAGLLERRRAHRDDTAKQHHELLAQLTEAREQASGGNAPTKYNCPECAAAVMFTPEGLKPYECPEKVADPDAAVKIQNLREPLNMMLRALENAERDLKASQDAAAALAELEAQPEADLPADTAVLNERLAEAKDRLRTLRQHDKMHADHEAAKATAAQKRDDAAELHARILGWLALSEALGPSGIRAELMTEALIEFNGRLELTSRLAHWAQVSVTQDMQILIGGRPYALCSESSKWRADALIAEAAAFWSSKLLVLDRVDVLDSSNRVSLILLLKYLSDHGQLGSVILLGTFKEPPRNLPACVTVHWMRDGRVASNKEEMAA